MAETWDLPKLQGRFEGFSEGILQRVSSLERKVAQPKECVGLLGQWFGHRFVHLQDFKTAKDLGMVCDRCGHAVWLPVQTDGQADG